MAIEVIAHTEVGSGGASSIDFTSIPGTYDDLWLQVSARFSNTNVTFATLYYRFNSDSATNYSRTIMLNNGGTASSSRQTNQTEMNGIAPSSTSTTSTFGSDSFYIANYKNSTSYKQIVRDSIWENNSTTEYWVASIAHLWRNTAAVTSIQISNGFYNFVQYSSATLYGITKA